MTGKQLFLEDVDVGSQIPSLSKQVTLLTMAMYSAATWNFYRIHWDNEFSRDLGFRHANIHGPFYGNFMTQMLTRWIGEEGRVRKLAYSNRAMGFPDDTLTTRGKVTRKYVRDGENLVECEVWVENEEGENLAPGTAVVALPSRASA